MSNNTNSIPEQVEIAIVGAGAAGLMAGIWAGRMLTRPHAILALDSARTLGAKILVAGGGRCNVTHTQVTATDFAGSTRPAIAKVLRQFDVPDTIAFFQELGVTLKQEETGKLFPVTDRAQTVLQALLAAARAAGVALAHPRRVAGLTREGDGYRLGGEWGSVWARQVILATGGQSLPKSGSDGSGYTLARALGHSITPHLLPALVPLTLPRDHVLCALSGLSALASLTLWVEGVARLTRAGPVLCTHFGLSGPAVLDMSRHYLLAQQTGGHVALTLNWLPDLTLETCDRALQGLGRTSPLAWLRTRLPERLARTLATEAGAEGLAALTRSQRQVLATQLTRYPLPITGHRGFNYAEATAGGVPLRELHLERMASRLAPGVYVCGELCDVDGRLGGFNFQWAWASGYVAGVAAGRAGAG